MTLNKGQGYSFLVPIDSSDTIQYNTKNLWRAQCLSVGRIVSYWEYMENQRF